MDPFAYVHTSRYTHIVLFSLVLVAGFVFWFMGKGEKIHMPILWRGMYAELSVTETWNITVAYTWFQNVFLSRITWARMMAPKSYQAQVLIAFAPPSLMCRFHPPIHHTLTRWLLGSHYHCCISDRKIKEKRKAKDPLTVPELLKCSPKAHSMDSAQIISCPIC